MLKETDYNIIMEGYKIIQDFSKIKGIPIGMTAMLREAYEKFSNDQIRQLKTPILLLDKTVKLPWE